eukprot:5498178-Amphidinium_carterae.1
MTIYPCTETSRSQQDTQRLYGFSLRSLHLKSSSSLSPPLVALKTPTMINACKGMSDARLFLQQ